MLSDKTIAVVVPAYNEEAQIGRVIETMPDFVDRIIIVNDFSLDKTSEVVQDYINNSKYNHRSKKIGSNINNIIRDDYNHADFIVQEKSKEEINYLIPSEIVNENEEEERVILINQLNNGGVGRAVARGYKWAKDHDIDCTAVMDGDGQMDPNELESICRPIVDEDVDYVKGNRLIHSSSWLVIPKTRFFGNSILSILTKVASGYWHVSDSQSGYTAISKGALNSIAIHKMYKHYGVYNDILVKLNIAFCTIREVKIKPVYHIGEQSKMKVAKVIPTVSWLLIRSFFKRLWIKYLFKDFHPLFLFYNLSFLLFTMSIPFGINVINNMLHVGEITPNAILIVFVFLAISGFQSLFFAMWMDIQDNERLYK